MIYRHRQRKEKPSSPQKYRYLGGKELTVKMPTPECSGVQENANSDYALAGSELSWLEKLAEANEIICDSTLLEEKTEHFTPNFINEMKFSFNQNYANPNQEIRKINVSNKDCSLKEIYYKQFEKQASKITLIQEERNKMLKIISQKRKTRNSPNKQNGAESMKRGNKQEEKLNNMQRKNHLNSQPMIEQSRRYSSASNNVLNKDDEAISLKYLQQSLAKKGQTKTNISKHTYLEDSSKHHSTICPRTIIVKQFDEREEYIIPYLQLLFDQLDGKKNGTLDKRNCYFGSIKQEFKIAFGYILIRIKLKDLVLNREDFVKLGLQIIKQLDSEQFNRLLKDVEKVKKSNIAEEIRLNQTVKRKSYQKNYHQNKGEDLLNQQKTGSFYFHGPHIGSSEDFYYTMSKNGKNQRGISPFKDQIFQNQQMYKNNVHRSPLTKKQVEKMILKYNKNYQSLQRFGDNQNSHLISLANYETLRDMPLLKRQKIRNISEQMLREHKRSLEDLSRLNQKMQNCLFRSRRVMEDVSRENYDLNSYNLMSGEFFRSIQ